MSEPAAPSPRAAGSIREVVQNGLCIGCGLCESLTGGRARMVMTAAGSLRPSPADEFTAAEEQALLAACPGVSVCAPDDAAAKPPHHDAVWGGYHAMRTAWAGDADIRFRASTGGVLTALGMHLLAAGKVKFILHVAADPDRPMRSRWRMSDTPAQAAQAAGSRYGPTAPLAGLEAALARRQPFALIAKPCDVSAVYNRAKTDARVDELCRYRLALVCGGQSRLGKSQAVLKECDVEEKTVTVFRYRGYGNPGRTRIETADGRAFEKTYDEMWGDESGWQIETRCKFCADALGECADVCAADVWENAAPAGEDAGINGIIIRTETGAALAQEAAQAGALALGEEITPREFDSFQPHQLRKKIALAARLDGLAAAGRPAPAADGLRIAELSERLDKAEYEKEKHGTMRRAEQGRFAEGG